jgi:hypothetical protein
LVAVPLVAYLTVNGAAPDGNRETTIAPRSGPGPVSDAVASVTVTFTYGFSSS